MDIQHKITDEVFLVTDTAVDWVDIFIPLSSKYISCCTLSSSSLRVAVTWTDNFEVFNFSVSF